MLLLLLSTRLAVAAPLSLEQARAVAVEHSLEVEAAAARATAARGDAIATWSGHLPSISAFATGSIGSGRTAFGFDRPVGTQVGVGLSGTWALVAPSSWQAAAAARQTARGKEAMALWARVEARRAATVAFADVLAATQAVSAWQTALADAQEGATAVAALVEVGTRPPADGARAQAEAAAIEARLRAAEGTEATACASLKGLLRTDPAAACSLETPQWTTLSVPRAAPEADHPALDAARAALQATQAELTGAWLERAPTVSASGTAAAYAADGSDLGPGWSAGIDIDLPLLAGGSIAGGIQGDRGRADAAQAELDAQLRDLSVARVGAEGRFRAALAGVSAQQAALDAAQAAYELVDQRFDAGLTPLQDWLAVRRDRDTAAVNMAEARREQLSALAALEAARGVW